MNNALDKINKIVDRFKFGNSVYMYYCYLNKFHVEPKSWRDIFEYIEYTGIENKIESSLIKDRNK